MKCKDCKYYDEFKAPISQGMPEQGMCRYSPPSSSGFPVVWQSDWCGKFEPTGRQYYKYEPGEVVPAE